MERKKKLAILSDLARAKRRNSDPLNGPRVRPMRERGILGGQNVVVLEIIFQISKLTKNMFKVIVCLVNYQLIIMLK